MDKAIVKTIPGMQAAALAGYNLKQINKIGFGTTRRTQGKKFGVKKPVKNLVRLGAVNLLGVGMIKATSDVVKDY